MPIYEYGCVKCGHQFEVLIRSDSDYPGRCPKCKAPKPTKQFSAFAVSTPVSSGEQCQACPASESGCPSSSCASSGCPLG